MSSAYSINESRISFIRYLLNEKHLLPIRGYENISFVVCIAASGIDDPTIHWRNISYSANSQPKDQTIRDQVEVNTAAPTVEEFRHCDRHSACQTWRLW